MTDHTGQTPLFDKFLIGSNYWPGHAGLNMWNNWQPEKIQVEISKMLELGFNVNRSFLFMPDFIPSGKFVDPVMLDRLDEFLQICETSGIQTILSFFVGHMSGEDWDVPWRGDRNFYTDQHCLDAQEIYVSTVVKKCFKSPSILAWILSNEIPNYESRGTADEVKAWAAFIRQCIRKIDTVHPICIGDGCWTPEVSRRLKNFQLRKLADEQDFLGLHFYPRSADPWRQSFTAAFRLGMARFWKEPVIVEEFGLSTAMSSEHNQALYYRDVLYSALINGAKGTLNWCFSDFELTETRPYSHHPHELRFGLMKSNGEIREAGREMQKFASMAKPLIAENWQPVEFQKCRLWIPSTYYYDYPYDWDNEFEEWYPFYLNTFSLLKRANLNPEMIFEPAIDLEKNGEYTHEIDLDPSDGQILFLPRLKRITASGWEKIKTYVKDGGTLYASFAHDAWIPDWEEFFQIKSDVKFGLPATDVSPVVCLQENKAFKFDDPCFATGSDSEEYASCPVLTAKGKAVLEDKSGRPILLHMQHGKGNIFFNTYPMEMLGLHDRTGLMDNILMKIYQYLRNFRGTKDPVSFHGIDIEAGVWKSPDNKKLKVILLNHAWSKRTGELRIYNSYGQLSDGKSRTYSLSAKTVQVIDLRLADGTYRESPDEDSGEN